MHVNHVLRGVQVKGEGEWGDRYRAMKGVRKEGSKILPGLREKKRGKKKLL